MSDLSLFLVYLFLIELSNMLAQPVPHCIVVLWPWALAARDSYFWLRMLTSCLYTLFCFICRIMFAVHHVFFWCSLFHRGLLLCDNVTPIDCPEFPPLVKGYQISSVRLTGTLVVTSIRAVLASVRNQLHAKNYNACCSALPNGLPCPLLASKKSLQHSTSRSTTM